MGISHSIPLREGGLSEKFLNGAAEKMPNPVVFRLLCAGESLNIFPFSNAARIEFCGVKLDGLDGGGNKRPAEGKGRSPVKIVEANGSLWISGNTASKCHAGYRFVVP